MTGMTAVKEIIRLYLLEVHSLSTGPVVTTTGTQTLTNKTLTAPAINNPTIGAVTGATIGAASTALIGFHGATPVDQAAAITDAAGGATVDAEARTAINAVLAALREKGLIAT